MAETKSSPIWSGLTREEQKRWIWGSRIWDEYGRKMFARLHSRPGYDERDVFNLVVESINNEYNLLQSLDLQKRLTDEDQLHVANIVQYMHKHDESFDRKPFTRKIKQIVNSERPDYKASVQERNEKGYASVRSILVGAPLKVRDEREAENRPSSRPSRSISRSRFRSRSLSRPRQPASPIQTDRNSRNNRPLGRSISNIRSRSNSLSQNRRSSSRRFRSRSFSR